jgi:C1A family cysteine protease
MVLIIFLALIILAIVLIFLYQVPPSNSSSSARSQQCPPNNLSNISHPKNQIPSQSNISMYSQLPPLQPRHDSVTPSIASNHKPSSIRRPVGTVSVYSLPQDIQTHLTAGVKTVPLRNIPVPDNFDARQKWMGTDSKGRSVSLITGPLDQEQCGSCWAFSTSSVLSDRWRINHPTDDQLTIFFQYYPNNIGTNISGESVETYVVLNNVSPYQLVSCDLCSPPGISQDPDGKDSLCNYGCSGGAIADAFDYLIHKGANSIFYTKPAAPNPLDASTFHCDFDQSLSVYQGTNKYVVAEVGPNGQIPNPDNREQVIKEEIYIHGPVSAAYTVYESFYTFFDKNPNGIYGVGPPPSNDNIIGGHAIVIIGWGIENGIKYWIVRNSWGKQWGNNGYFKIKSNWTPPDPIDQQGQRTLGIMDEVWAITAP